MVSVYWRSNYAFKRAQENTEALNVDDREEVPYAIQVENQRKSQQ